MKLKTLFAVAAMMTASVVGASSAEAVTIQPNESASKDSWAYQFFSTTDFGSTYFAILAAGQTGSGHDFEAFVQFDLSSVSLTADDVASATVSLYAISSESTGFGASSSSTYPLDVSAYAATSNWSESLTWGSRPTYNATAADTVTMTGVNQLYTFDVTDAVKAWLTTPSSNFGLRIAADEILRTTPGNTAVIAVFDSASGPNGPALNITAVPEPTSVAVIAGIGAAMLLRRRKA